MSKKGKGRRRTRKDNSNGTGSNHAHHSRRIDHQASSAHRSGIGGTGMDLCEDPYHGTQTPHCQVCARLCAAACQRPEPPPRGKVAQATATPEANGGSTELAPLVKEDERRPQFIVQTFTEPQRAEFAATLRSSGGMVVPSTAGDGDHAIALAPRAGKKRGKGKQQQRQQQNHYHHQEHHSSTTSLQHAQPLETPPRTGNHGTKGSAEITGPIFVRVSDIHRHIDAIRCDVDRRYVTDAFNVLLQSTRPLNSAVHAADDVHHDHRHGGTVVGVIELDSGIRLHLVSEAPLTPLTPATPSSPMPSLRPRGANTPHGGVDSGTSTSLVAIPDEIEMVAMEKQQGTTSSGPDNTMMEIDTEEPGQDDEQSPQLKSNSHSDEAQHLDILELGAASMTSQHVDAMVRTVVEAGFGGAGSAGVVGASSGGGGAEEWDMLHTTSWAFDAIDWDEERACKCSASRGDRAMSETTALLGPEATAVEGDVEGGDVGVCRTCGGFTEAYEPPEMRRMGMFLNRMRRARRAESKILSGTTQLHQVDWRDLCEPPSAADMSSLHQRHRASAEAYLRGKEDPNGVPAQLKGLVEYFDNCEAEYEQLALETTEHHLSREHASQGDRGGVFNGRLTKCLTDLDSRLNECLYAVEGMLKTVAGLRTTALLTRDAARHVASIESLCDELWKLHESALHKIIVKSIQSRRTYYLQNRFDAVSIAENDPCDEPFEDDGSDAVNLSPSELKHNNTAMLCLNPRCRRAVLDMVKQKYTVTKGLYENVTSLLSRADTQNLVGRVSMFTHAAEALSMASHPGLRAMNQFGVAGSTLGDDVERDTLQTGSFMENVTRIEDKVMIARLHLAHSVPNHTTARDHISPLTHTNKGEPIDAFLEANLGSNCMEWEQVLGLTKDHIKKTRKSLIDPKSFPLTDAMAINMNQVCTALEDELEAVESNFRTLVQPVQQELQEHARTIVALKREARGYNATPSNGKAENSAHWSSEEERKSLRREVVKKLHSLKLKQFETRLTLRAQQVRNLHQRTRVVRMAMTVLNLWKKLKRTITLKLCGGPAEARRRIQAMITGMLFFHVEWRAKEFLAIKHEKELMGMDSPRAVAVAPTAKSGKRGKKKRRNAQGGRKDARPLVDEPSQVTVTPPSSESEDELEPVPAAPLREDEVGSSTDDDASLPTTTTAPATTTPAPNAEPHVVTDDANLPIPRQEASNEDCGDQTAAVGDGERMTTTTTSPTTLGDAGPVEETSGFTPVPSTELSPHEEMPQSATAIAQNEGTVALEDDASATTQPLRRASDASPVEDKDGGEEERQVAKRNGAESEPNISQSTATATVPASEDQRRTSPQSGNPGSFVISFGTLDELEDEQGLDVDESDPGASQFQITFGTFDSDDDRDGRRQAQDPVAQPPPSSPPPPPPLQQPRTEHYNSADAITTTEVTSAPMNRTDGLKSLEGTSGRGGDQQTPRQLADEAAAATASARVPAKGRRSSRRQHVGEGDVGDHIKLGMPRALSVGRNNCFVNVIVQSLWYLTPVRKRLAFCEPSTPASRATDKGHHEEREASLRVYRALQDVFSGLSGHDDSKVVAENGAQVVSVEELREALYRYDLVRESTPRKHVHPHVSAMFTTGTPTSGGSSNGDFGDGVTPPSHARLISLDDMSDAVDTFELILGALEMVVGADVINELFTLRTNEHYGPMHAHAGVKVPPGTSMEALPEPQARSPPHVRATSEVRAKNLSTLSVNVLFLRKSEEAHAQRARSAATASDCQFEFAYTFDDVLRAACELMGDVVLKDGKPLPCTRTLRAKPPAVFALELIADSLRARGDPSEIQELLAIIKPRIDLSKILRTAGADDVHVTLGDEANDGAVVSRDHTDNYVEGRTRGRKARSRQKHVGASSQTLPPNANDATTPPAHGKRKLAQDASHLADRLVGVLKCFFCFHPHRHHYVVFCYDTVLQVWVMFDDDKVVPVGRTYEDAAEASSRGGFMPHVFFYEMATADAALRIGAPDRLASPPSSTGTAKRTPNPNGIGQSHSQRTRRDSHGSRSRSRKGSSGGGGGGSRGGDTSECHEVRQRGDNVGTRGGASAAPTGNHGHGRGGSRRQSGRQRSRSRSGGGGGGGGGSSSANSNGAGGRDGARSSASARKGSRTQAARTSSADVP